MSSSKFFVRPYGLIFTFCLHHLIVGILLVGLGVMFFAGSCATPSDNTNPPASGDTDSSDSNTNPVATPTILPDSNSCQLTVNIQGQGTVAPASGAYKHGAMLNLAATAASGWMFVGWEGAITGTANPAVLTLDSDKTVKAMFEQIAVKKWDLLTGGGICSTPAVAPDGTIYVGSNDGYLYSLKNDGSIKWTFLTGGWIITAPAIGSNGIIYVGSLDGKVYAVNPDGTKKWEYDTGN